MRIKTIVASGLAVALFGLMSSAQAGTIYVNERGVAGWVSGDTRPAAGGAATEAQIDDQIKFLGEGVVANDAAGLAQDASPAGSLGGLGFVRLDGTSLNAGKSDLSFFDFNGIAPALSLLNFGAQFRYYKNPNIAAINPQSRTPGLAISVSDGTNFYSFSYVDLDGTPGAANTWLTAVVDGTSLFGLFGTGSLGTGPGGALSNKKTMADWAADPTFGALLGPSYKVVRVGFNIGSFQSRGLVYIDWLETSLLNGGDTIDFVSADFVPTPTFTCVGFEPPADRDVVVKKPNRVVPLRMTLLDGDGTIVWDVAAPVVSVGYSGSHSYAPGELEELNFVGRGDEGNMFAFDGSKWAFNLSTKGLAKGEYTLTAVAGSPDYVIDPTCEVVVTIQ